MWPLNFSSFTLYFNFLRYFIWTLCFAIWWNCLNLEPWFSYSDVLLLFFWLCFQRLLMYELEWCVISVVTILFFKYNLLLFWLLKTLTIRHLHHQQLLTLLLTLLSLYYGRHLFFSFLWFLPFKIMPSHQISRRNNFLSLISFYFNDLEIFHSRVF